jgi:hypothetical protein
LYPWRAFDKTNAEWASGAGADYSAGVATTNTQTSGLYNGAWLQIKLPIAINLYSYSLTSPPNWSIKSPAKWYILGSNDGTTWTVVDSQQTAVTWTGVFQVKTFIPTPTIAYSYYRIVVNEINGTTPGGGLVEISEWILYGAPPNTATDFYADRLGNLLTAPVTGQSLANWLGGATGYVTKWYDQSGTNHATQDTAALQPKIDLVNKQIDFKPSAYFNLPNGTVPFGNTNYTMIVKHNTINTVWGGIIGSGTYGTTNGVNALEWNSTAYFHYWWGNDMSGGTLTSGNVVSAKYDNTIGRTLYVNGTSVATNTNKNRNSTNIQNTIGTDLRGNQGQSGGNRYLNGELYYVFLFGTALSDTDRTLVEALPIT